MQPEVVIPNASSDVVTDVFDRMSDGILVVDAVDRILYRNPTAAALLGPSVTATLPLAFRGLGERDWMEIELGHGRFAEMSVVAVPWDGSAARLISIRDVTERRRTQASLVVLADELRSANAHLRMLADVDPLTGLLNRRGLARVLETQIAPRMRSGFDLVAIMVDCDGFKNVNDMLDHVAGDFVLRQVGERLRSALRPGDPLARVGGDEFLVLLPGGCQADALRIANRIREVVARSPIPIPSRNREVTLTVSVGVARIPRHVKDPDEIVRRADARLRQSKLAGKNRVTGPLAGPERDASAGE